MRSISRNLGSLLFALKLLSNFFFDKNLRRFLFQLIYFISHYFFLLFNPSENLFSEETLRILSRARARECHLVFCFSARA